MTRLSDLMSSLSVTTYTQLALILFVAVFAAVVLREIIGTRKQNHGTWSRLPLADDDASKGDPS